MKRLLPLFLLAICLSGCKTTEANYRAAYQTAIAKRQADLAQQAQDIDALGAEASSAIRRQNRPQIYISGADTLSTYPIALARPDFSSTVPRFSVAVNSFEQKFNANAMTKRLMSNGFSGAFVAQASGPVYYVITNATDSLQALPAMLREADRARSLGMGRDFPIIIRNTSFRPSHAN